MVAACNQSISRANTSSTSTGINIQISIEKGCCFYYKIPRHIEEDCHKKIIDTSETCEYYRIVGHRIP